MMYESEIDALKHNTTEGTSLFLEYSKLPLIKKAKEDFRYLCAQQNLNARDKLNLVRLEKVNTIGDFLIVGVDSNDKVVQFPAEFIDPTDNTQFVMLFTYLNDKVDEVYIFNASNFGGKQKLFSLFGKSKIGNYTIKIKSKDKLKPYLYGTVMDELLKSI